MARGNPKVWFVEKEKIKQKQNQEKGSRRIRKEQVNDIFGTIMSG